MSHRDAETQKGSTADNILDAAECLFAEHGYKATTMRMITQRARVNLAAVNYHFGHKQDLFQHVLRRRLRLLNLQRLRALDQLEAAIGNKVPSAEQVLRAFFSPVVEMVSDDASGGPAFMRLLGRAYSFPDEDVAQFIAGEYGLVMERYLKVGAQVFPEISRAELAWRLHFMTGAVTYAVSGADILSLVRDEPAPAPSELIDRLIVFFVGGLQAPAGPGNATADG